jgi:hypothetical protein
MKFVGICVVLGILIFSGLTALRTPAESVSRFERKLTPSTTPTPTDDQTPLYSSYRGISIRTPAAQVAEKLGIPAQRSKAGDYYIVSPTESVQISYDTDQTVKAISVNFTGDLKAAPTPKDVIGTDIKKDADGAISKIVTYPKNGFWVSYMRTGGKDATIVITLKKMAIE